MELWTLIFGPNGDGSSACATRTGVATHSSSPPGYAPLTKALPSVALRVSPRLPARSRRHGPSAW